MSFGNAAKPLVEGATVEWPQTLTPAAGGKLGTLLGLSGPEGALASYRSALDETASALAKSVNALHTSTPFFSGTSAPSTRNIGGSPDLRWMSEVATKVWMRGFLACFTASQHRSMSPRPTRLSPQIDG